MKYVIFCDIDGTLYGDDQIIHPDNMKAIFKAQKAGVEFTLCTGNGFFSNIQNLAKKLDVRYLVLSNGAAIYDIQERKYLYKNIFPQKSAQKLLDYALEHKLAANWWDEEDIYANEFVAEQTRIRLKKVMLGVNKNVLTSSKIRNDIFKIEFYNSVKDTDMLMKFIETHSEWDLQMARSKPGHVEVTHEGVNKGKSLKWLCEYKNWNLKSTMGIGDSANDIEMFKTVGFAYAMANAPQSFKNHAQYHTSAVEQAGLAEAIEDFMYRNKIEAK